MLEIFTWTSEFLSISAFCFSVQSSMLDATCMCKTSWPVLDQSHQWVISMQALMDKKDQIWHFVQRNRPRSSAKFWLLEKILNIFFLGFHLFNLLKKKFCLFYCGLLNEKWKSQIYSVVSDFEPRCIYLMCPLLLQNIGKNSGYVLIGDQIFKVFVLQCLEF